MLLLAISALSHSLGPRICPVAGVYAPPYTYIWVFGRIEMVDCCPEYSVIL